MVFIVVVLCGDGWFYFRGLFCFVKWVIDLLLVLLFGGWVIVSCCAL